MISEVPLESLREGDMIETNGDGNGIVSYQRYLIGRIMHIEKDSDCDCYCGCDAEDDEDCECCSCPTWSEMDEDEKRSHMTIQVMGEIYDVNGRVLGTYNSWINMSNQNGWLKLRNEHLGIAQIRHPRRAIRTI